MIFVFEADPTSVLLTANLSLEFNEVIDIVWGSASTKMPSLVDTEPPSDSVSAQLRVVVPELDVFRAVVLVLHYCFIGGVPAVVTISSKTDLTANLFATHKICQTKKHLISIYVHWRNAITKMTHLTNTKPSSNWVRTQSWVSLLETKNPTVDVILTLGLYSLRLPTIIDETSLVPTNPTVCDEVRQDRLKFRHEVDGVSGGFIQEVHTDVYCDFRHSLPFQECGVSLGDDTINVLIPMERADVDVVVFQVPPLLPPCEVLCVVPSLLNVLLNGL